MKTPIGTKQAVWGFVGGAVVTLIVGFAWGGWVTARTATQQADQQSGVNLVAAFTSICVAQSQADPKAKQVIDQMKATDSWKRGDILKPTGWATMPGSSAANTDVIRACADKLST